MAAPYYFSASEGDFVCQDAVFDISGAGNFRVSFDRERVLRAMMLMPPAALAHWVAGSEIRAVIPSWRESVSR